MKRKLFLLLCALLTMIGVQAQNWSGNAPAEGTFFLYNVEAQKFLNNGDPNESWGTNAYLQAGFGMDIKLEANGGAFNLNTNVSNGGNNHYLATSTWCDGGPTPWTFVAVDGQANTYTIKNGDNCLVANDALNDVEYKASTSDAKSWWKLVSLDDFKAAMAAKEYSETNPMDVSVFIKGRSFARNDGRNTAWVTTHNGGNWTWIGGSENKYYGNEAWNNTFDVHQEITGLPVGTYKLSCSGFGTNGTTYIYGSTGGTTYQKLIQTDNTTPRGTNAAAKWAAIQLDNAFAGQDTDPFFVANGVLTAGIKRETNKGGDWCVWDEFRLYYYGLDLSQYVTAYHDAKAGAKGIDQSQPMQASVKTDLQETIAAYETIDETSLTQLQEATTALANAALAANNSIAAYANAKAYLDEAAVILAGTNVYTAEAYADKYTTPLAKYEARTLTNEEANSFVKTSTGWHSNNTIDEILLSAWTIGGNQCHKFDTPLYINTWSTEGATDGSEFLAPFFEYWVGDGDVLGANTIVATVAGLNPNATYSFTIRARVRQTNNKTKIANGVTMKVGAGEAVDISAGAKFGTTSFYIGNFSAVGETDADGKLTMTMTVAENSNISWLSFYNAKWTEGEDLSAYIADYEFAKSTAIANRDNAAYAAVTGKERVDLVNTITTYSAVDVTSKAALIEAKEALEAASNTFVSAAPAYIGIAELNPNVAATLGVALPTITSETVAADLDVNGIIVAEYTAAKTYAQDFTNKLGAWTNAPGLNQGQSWNGTDDDQYYDLYNAADRAMTQTVTLPAGNYALIAKGRAAVNGLLTLVVGDETVTFPHKSDVGRGIATDGTATFADNAIYANNNAGRGWEYRVMTFTSDGATPITLTFNWKTSSYNWCGLDDIVLLCNPAALDYSALQTAYDAVVVPTLGFEAGEYAPYNNKENLANISIAKNLLDNKDADNQETIDNATAAITGMTWNANAEELNAVYDGNFAIQPEHTTGPTALAGWNNPAGIRQLIKNTETYPGLNTASAKAAVFAWGGTTMKYGETDGYTIPLKGHAIYELSFKTCGWADGDMGHVNVDVKNASDEGLQTVSTVVATKRITEENPWDEFKILFVTGEAGNYKLGMWTSKHTTFTDIVLKKAASQTLTITDGEALPKFAPGTYPSATYTRTILAESKYGTICLPFNVKSDDNIQYYTVEQIEGDVLLLETTEEVEAGVPAVFKKLTADAEEISVTTANAEVVAAPVAQVGDMKLVGTFSDINVSENVEKCYYIKSNAFWQGYDNFNVKAYRAYIQTDVNEARLIIKTDGEDPTAINAIEAEEAEDGALKDGKYLIDGKVILVKNGVKYSANGQKLN
jgi:hypothetical protein